MMRSSISPGSTFARLITSLITGAAIVGVVVSLNAPRYALPIGVRAVDTITASLMIHSSLGFLLSRLGTVSAIFSIGAQEATLQVIPKLLLWMPAPLEDRG